MRAASGEAVADDEVGLVPGAPEAFEIVRVVLAVAVQADDPFHRLRQARQDVMQRGRLAVVRPAQRHDLRTGLGRDLRRGVAAGVVDDDHGETGVATTTHHVPDGRRFIARGDEDEGGRFHVGKGTGGGTTDGIAARTHCPLLHRRPDAVNIVVVVEVLEKFSHLGALRIV